jgi:hypothetical protein
METTPPTAVAIPKPKPKTLANPDGSGIQIKTAAIDMQTPVKAAALTATMFKVLIIFL